MIRRRTVATVVAFLAAVVLGSSPARAACNPLSFCSCTVTATGVSFGNYNPLSTTNVNSTGSIRVRCTLIAALSGSYTISLSAGASNSYTQRSLRNGSSSLGYNLYTNSARNQIWGNGTGGSSSVTQSFAALLSIDQTTTIYARIPPSQNVPGGVYGDTITVTVTY